MWWRTIALSAVLGICLALLVPAVIATAIVVILVRRRRRQTPAGGDGHA
jgi:hypothetical protein